MMSLDLTAIDADLDALGVSEVDKARAISLALGFKRPASLSDLDAALDALRSEAAPASEISQAEAEVGLDPSVALDDLGGEPIALDAPAEPIEEDDQSSELAERLGEELFDELGLEDELAALSDALSDGDSPFSVQREPAQAESDKSDDESEELFTSYDRPSAQPAAIELDDEEVEIMELDDLEIIEDDDLEPIS